MTACAALVGMDLFLCLARNPACLPPQYGHDPVFLAAIAQQESGLRPYAIRDERTRESLFPPTRAEAERIAAARDAAGHTLGLGWFQITHRANWARHGLTIQNAFDPCTNMRAGAKHFAEDMRFAALQRYNSGRTNGAPAYAGAVLARYQRLSAGAPNAVVAPAPRAPDPTPEPNPTVHSRGEAGRVFSYSTR